MGLRTWAAVLAGLTLLHLGLAAWMPPAEDELYYWCWSKQLQASYYDHPAVTAWIVRLSTELFGDSLFAVRLPACLAALASVLLLATVTRHRGLMAATLLSPLSVFGAVVLTPDAPFILAWSAYLAWLAAAHRRLTPPPEGAPSASLAWWVVGGIVLGLGVLSKYTMGLAVPAALVSFLLVRPWRRWLPGYALHLAVAFLVATPILYHNWRLDFAPLRFQWGHVMVNREPSPAGFPAFLVTQVGLVGLLPFALPLWAAWRWRTLAADPTLRAAACLYLLPLAFFLWKATRGPLEANWPVAAYLGCWPVAAAWLSRGKSPLRPTLAALAFAPAALATLGVGAHLVRPLDCVPPDADRLTRCAETRAVADRVAAVVRGLGDTSPVFAPTYQWTAELRFAGLPAEQWPGLTRDSQFTQTPAHPDQCGSLLYFADGPLPADRAAGFGPPEVVALVPLAVRGRPVTCYLLTRYRRIETPAAPL
jgi:4-amino-4-deoxy-L-arabinose transferase-like glycosyltransferase